MGDHKDNGINIDPAFVRALAELLDDTQLSEIEVEDGERKVRVARTLTAAAAPVAFAPAPVAAPVAAAPAAAAPACGKMKMAASAKLMPPFSFFPCSRTYRTAAMPAWNAAKLTANIAGLTFRSISPAKSIRVRFIP